MRYSSTSAYKFINKMDIGNFSAGDLVNLIDILGQNPESLYNMGDFMLCIPRCASEKEGNRLTDKEFLDEYAIMIACNAQRILTKQNIKFSLYRKNFTPRFTAMIRQNFYYENVVSFVQPLSEINISSFLGQGLHFYEHTLLLNGLMARTQFYQKILERLVERILDRNNGKPWLDGCADRAAQRLENGELCLPPASIFQKIINHWENESLEEMDYWLKRHATHQQKDAICKTANIIAQKYPSAFNRRIQSLCSHGNNLRIAPNMLVLDRYR